MCYVACEGDLGLVYTIMVLIAARGLGYPIALHHHSFSYIDQSRSLMRAVLFAGGDVLHIFLCSIMREKFERTYRRSVRSVILSNAAFVPPQVDEIPERQHGGLVLGHLSNLNREKGLYLYLDLLRSALKAGLDLRGILAGPAARAEDRAAIDQAVVELGARLDYRGPLYGADKDRFYRDIDVFVFPTQYQNEAQPTVLFEAQAAGNLILSFDRGCIAEQVGSNGLVFARESDFVGFAVAWLKDLAVAASVTEHRRRCRPRNSCGETR